MVGNRLKLTRDYLSRKTRIATYPSVVGIETTGRCNLDCIMCPRIKMTRQAGDMEPSLFEKIIDDISGRVEFVWLQDYGEPLLNKNIFRMIRYAKKRGLSTGISTNATALTGDAAENILSSGLDYIIFAFDGATKETYEKIRKGADYAAVKQNIERFLAKKTEQDAEIFTAVQCIYMEETEREIDDFMAAWDTEGVDGIRVRQLTFSGNKDKFRNTLHGRPCYWLWSDPHIKWDGTVVPCCQDVNAEYPLGNISEEPLGVLWNSDKMLWLRERHISGKQGEIPLCRDCNMYQPGLPLIIGSSFFSYKTVNKLVPKIETILSRKRFK